MSAHDALENVKDAGTFLAFLQALLDELPRTQAIEATDAQTAYFSGIDGWMNQHLPSFLEAAIAGGTDNKIGTDATDLAGTWRAAADIIYLGKIYE